MYVEVFDELLTKKVTLESLLQVALRADYYLNVSEIGARVIAQSVRNETGKQDPRLKKLRDKVNPLWDTYGLAHRNARRSKRDASSEVRSLHKEVQAQFSDMTERLTHNSDEVIAHAAWLSHQTEVKRMLRHMDSDLYSLTDPQLNAPTAFDIDQVRRSCASAENDPTDLLINIKVLLDGWCPFGYCHLFRLVSFERFTIGSLNRFAAILHEDFVRIIMHRSICCELLNEELEEKTKAVFRRRFGSLFEETVQNIVTNVESIKEDYWPQEALRLAKKVIGDTDVPLPEADAVEKIYRPIAQRIKANLSASYPWYSYEVVVHYPHDLADDHATWKAEDVAQTRSPHRNVHVAIFRRNRTSSSEISPAEFSEKKVHIAELFKSGGSLSSGLRALQDSMPMLVGDVGFSNGFAMKCHRSSAPAAWSTSPFSFEVDNYSGILLFRRCAFISFFL